jgi:N-acetylglucosamine kinase-like BadF-type ATPase
MAKHDGMKTRGYFLGFDGGGTKTDCVLADSNGKILARAVAGPSNPLRSGYTKAWFSLSEAADVVLSREKLCAENILGICAGLGGAGRSDVIRRATAFFQRGYPNAKVRVTTDLEIAFEAAFGLGEGILLLGGTGSAAFGRDAGGRIVRAGGRGPWFSDEGSAFDIGRRAFAAVVLADEHRGPATGLSGRILNSQEASDWNQLLDQVAKSPDSVFPKTFPLVAELADAGDAVCREILAKAALALASLAAAVAKEMGAGKREISIAKVGGIFGRSKYFDGKIEEELRKAVPNHRTVRLETGPAEAAARMAIRNASEKGNAA